MINIRRCAYFSIAILAMLVLSASAETKRGINFPDIPGYKTLVCDFHTHTVFSDGSVWPTVRMQEARREGLDAIAITDHIEYRPFEEYVKGDLNASYDVASPEALRNNMVLIRGTEITRETPPGHFNAIFIEDVNPIETEEFLDAVAAANAQGGFVFWNHPGWKGPEKGQWEEIHQLLYDKGWLHGVEVLNGRFYYAAAQQWCLDKDLAMLGNSDIHAPSMRHSTEAGDHRALTLVFAKELTLDSIQEALMSARTAAWDDKRMIGREEHLAPLFKASVEVFPPHHEDDRGVWFEIKNKSHIAYELVRTGAVGPETLTLEANASIVAYVRLYAPENESDEPLRLEYTAENILIAPDQGLSVTLIVPR